MVISNFRFYSFLIIYLLAFLCFSAQAQILNIERFRMNQDTSKVWLGNAGAGFTIKKQKNTVYTLNGNLNAVYLSEKHSFMSLNFIKFIRQESTNIISEGYAHGRITLLRRKHLSYEPFLQYQYDIGRGLIRRELYGYTFRYSIASGEKASFSANTGAMYEHEIWEGEVLRFPLEGTANRAEAKFVKSTSNVSVRANLTKSLYLFFVGYYQARFEAFFRPRIITDIQLQLKVNKYLSINTQFVSTYDSFPLLAENNFVYTLNHSLVITFKP